MADPENDIMTLEEVAEYLRLKPQIIYTWAQEKKIPAAKLGKEWRFRRSVIDKWFNQHIDDKFGDFFLILKKIQELQRTTKVIYYTVFKFKTTNIKEKSLIKTRALSRQYSY